MRLLQRNFDGPDALRRRLRAGDRRARAAAREGGRRSTGSTTSTASRPARARRRASVAAGDRVWWDHHDWGAAMRIPAVVGSFPEPFLSAASGKRLPVRLDCADDAGRACDEVADAARGRGRDGRSARGTVGVARRAGACCGCWSGAGPRCARDPPPQQIEQRARQASRRVRAAEPATGDAIALLDSRGRPVRTLGAGRGPRRRHARSGDQAPTWVVTGTDDVGVAAAAAALDRGPPEGPLRARDRGRARRSPLPLPADAGAGAVTYRRRSTPLHAARAAVGSAVVRRAGGGRAVVRAPADPAGDRARGAVLAAAAAAQVRRRRCCARSLWALPFALVIALVNALVVRDGLTVIVRGSASCRGSGSSTSRSRRPPTAACSGCGRWS